MINRILIRMKTVQLLYSYLLVEKPFSLEARPSAPTKEKRFAYGLYLDLIYLMYKIAHIVEGKNKKKPLAQSRFILKISHDDKFKALLAQNDISSYAFSSIENDLAAEIKNSLLFKEYEKKTANGEEADKFWENIYNAIISQNPEVTKIIRQMPGYSLSGMERMKLLMNETFKNFYSSKGNIDDVLNTLKVSMNQARDLYMRLLALPVELTELREFQLEQNRNKLLASVEDLNPNMHFVNNLVAPALENNKDFKDYIEKIHLSWRVEDPELLEILLKAVLNSNAYKDYVSKEANTLARDAEFWRNIFTEVIFNNKDFLEYLENKSVFWNDDLEIMGSFVLKTLKRLESEEHHHDAVLPMYKDGDEGRDAHFGAELIKYVLTYKEIYRQYIDDALSHDKWETDRLAFIDMVIIMTALAEILNYPEIPLTASINEYIEIAKSYSSAKSGQFVHGLLASIIVKLKEEGLLKK